MHLLIICDKVYMFSAKVAGNIYMFPAKIDYIRLFAKQQSRLTKGKPGAKRKAKKGGLC